MLINIGSERVSAKTGTMDKLGYYPSNWLTNEMSHLNIAVQDSSASRFSNAATQVLDIHQLLNSSLPALNTTDNYIDLYDDTHDPKKMDVYYFHPDHLGSSSYITNMRGMVSQHMEYLPFGELLVDEHKNSYNSPFKYNGKEFDEETGNYFYGARYYDPKWSIFISVDPLAEKYPHESPYIYVSNNPILYIDPDGREKIIALDKNKDKIIIAGAEKYKDDNAIHIFAHGSSKGMSVVIDGKTTRIRTAKQLEAFLAKNSETWQNKGENDKVTIVLHSCNVGRDNKDGTASFAEKVSESDIFKDATIVAPNERVSFSESGEIGAYKAKYANEHGEYKRDENGEIKSTERSDTPGSWRIFEKGKQTGQYRGDWKPKEQPTRWDNFTKKEEVK